jgi:aerobic-type carbon monoxide dehydrogenase small subunit (CoxS/CutS family)
MATEPMRDDVTPTPMVLQVNGRAVTVAVEGDTPLLFVLRDTLGLTGSKYGCGIAACGACTVHLDGRPERSCVRPVSTLAGTSITTIEGAIDGASGAVVAAVQAAWVALDVPQCGYCQSGQVMAASALLMATPAPTDADIDRAMEGNVCRCGAYPRIRAGIHQAAAALRGMPKA